MGVRARTAYHPLPSNVQWHIILRMPRRRTSQSDIYSSRLHLRLDAPFERSSSKSPIAD